MASGFGFLPLEGLLLLGSIFAEFRANKPNLKEVPTLEVR